MGLSAAVQWWEEWQLRILVLSSLTVQRLLLLSALWRRRAIPWWFRSLIWLAYLGSDALAIYSLAALFNRRRKQEDWANAASSRALEALWVPILLMHLGGQDGITAYNIEDNELWRRHVLTAVSQVTVAIYVFCKSWPGGDNNLLKAAVLLFINGVLKCLEKPLALKNASINSLVSSSEPARRTAKREGEINPVEKYVREAKNIIVLSSVQHKSQDEEQEGGNLAQDTHHHPSNEKRHAVAVHREQYEPQEERGESTSQDNGCPPPQEEGDAAYAIGLFHNSHREGYNGRDVKITYILLCCTAALEVLSVFSNANFGRRRRINPVTDKSSWPGMVPQYSLAGFFVRNKRHAKKMRTVSLFGCKDYLDQHWCMKSCSSSYRITVLVLQYLKAGWRDYVQDAATYMMFNDHRGQWTLNRNKCNHHVWSLNCPFDESVLLWHIATELCFFWSAFPGYRFAFSEVKSTWQILLKGVENDRRTNFQCGELTCCKAVQCRQMSNYMVYLLFVNPEMLLPGSRRNLFTTAYGELKRILEDKKPEPTWWRAGIRQRNKPPVEEKELTEEGFIHDAWTLTQELLALGDEDKMWEVIEGVWVEMLCFSAGRCRGYLHAKALGTGGELLTYVWLLMSYMGMETLAERMQRTELPSGAGNDGAAPSTSGLPNGPAAASGPEVRTDTAPSTSRFPSGAGSSASTEVPTATGAAPSTSEIRMADGEDMV
ncbi:unnamed protein product [Urochloa decumbens]|uniref:DUF4220 domain-containing protein n=1 Tax=Urochloa decumbens TaxID=240449 RepID=A0ABC9FVX7_9POAL